MTLLRPFRQSGEEPFVCQTLSAHSWGCVAATLPRFAGDLYAQSPKADRKLLKPKHQGMVATCISHTCQGIFQDHGAYLYGKIC